MVLTSRTPDWSPPFDDGERTLREVLASMPGDPADSIPWFVKLLENPASPIALPGAVDLFSHDCIHVLLGRGLGPADEAFVIGFTMGSSGQLFTWQAQLFRWCSAHLYRGRYRFSARDRAVFDLGVWLGRETGARPLDAIDFRPLLPLPLAEARRQLGIRFEVLCRGYELERQLWSATTASTGCNHGLS